VARLADASGDFHGLFREKRYPKEVHHGVSPMKKAPDESGA